MQAGYNFSLQAFWAVSYCDASSFVLHRLNFVMQFMQGYAGERRVVNGVGNVNIHLFNFFRVARGEFWESFEH